jgi:hypothetical protein
MKHAYLKVNINDSYTKKILKLKHIADSGHWVYAGKNADAAHRSGSEIDVRKNDSMIMQDFFGALNY